MNQSMLGHAMKRHVTGSAQKRPGGSTLAGGQGSQVLQSGVGYGYLVGGGVAAKFAVCVWVAFDQISFGAKHRQLGPAQRVSEMPRAQHALI